MDHYLSWCNLTSKDLAQLERAWALAAERKGEPETLPFPVYTAAKDLSFALYRDFPDSFRSGEPDN